MKKFLMFLCCVLCASGAYSDDDRALLKKSVDNLRSQYLEKNLDLGTAQSMCKKVFQYAGAHNIQIVVEVENKIFWPNITDCDTDKESDLTFIVWLTTVSSKQIVDANIEPHSACVQKKMESEALLNCGNAETWRTIRKSEGYDVSGLNDKPIIKCSGTDNRCLVGRTLSKNGQNYLQVSCCMMPEIKCNETTEVSKSNTSGNSSYSSYYHSSNVSEYGEMSMPWIKFLRDMPELSYFDYGCNPVVDIYSVDDNPSDGTNVLQEIELFDEEESSDGDLCEQKALEDSAIEYMRSFKSNKYLVDDIWKDISAECSVDDNYCVVNLKMKDGTYLAQCIKADGYPAFVRHQGQNYGADDVCECGGFDWSQSINKYSGQSAPRALRDFDSNCNKISR